jgi:hypothetical protein
VGIANGGTGQTTANAAFNALAPAQTANRLLKSDGTNTSFAQAVLTTDVTGTLPIANGGTGVTTLAALGNLFYPVGSIYTNATDATNPGTLLGFGTWTAFGAGRVPVGFDAGNVLFDTAEETGGSADAIVVSHTHTATQHQLILVTIILLVLILVLVMLVAAMPLLLERLKHMRQQLTLQTSLQQQQLHLRVQVAQMPTTSRTLLCICGNAQPDGVEN